MGRSPALSKPERPFFIIFTDLDGTLLDHDSYRWQEAAPALHLCQTLQVPVVLVSSKTRAEMEVISQELPIDAPFISENGGGVYIPMETIEPFIKPPAGAYIEKGLWKYPLGVTYPALLRALREISAELSWHVRGFADMSLDEVSRLTGLDEQASRSAMAREFDEPFIVTGRTTLDDRPLIEAASKRSLNVSVGGRFYHLHGKNDKGVAMEKVISWYKGACGTISSIALGDSPNDFPMLERADFPVLIASGKDFSWLKAQIPRLRQTREMGPTGWNAVVMEILSQVKERRHG
jgi:mannosyl-3-phosphoglycerate phosphatase